MPKLAFRKSAIEILRDYIAMCISFVCLVLTQLKLAMHWVILVIVNQFLSLSVLYLLRPVPF